MSPFVRLLVKVVRSVRAAGLPRAPAEPAKDGSAARPAAHDWEGLGRDLGRAVRKFRDGERPRQ